MFRLVTFREEEPSEKKIVECISPVVSRTILDAMAFIFQAEKDYEEFYESIDGDHFFKGIGKYYKTSDGKAGYEIYRRKLERMKQKLEDPAEYYTFDLLEERLLFEMIMVFIFYFDLGLPEMDEIDQKASAKEKQLTEKLISDFGMDQETAAPLSQDACHFQKMALDDEEDDNLIFWDDDYLFFFQEGFAAGLQHMVAAEGDMAGYGYQYAVHLFEDIDLKAPVLLIGTEESHRMANEQTMQRYYKNLERIAGVSSDDNPADDENLPFN